MDNSGSIGATAIVEYDYTAKEPDELDLIKGDIIHNIKVKPGGWWEGTVAANGKIGMFPDNFVRIVDNAEEKSPVILRDKSATVHRRCKVIYSYTQNNDDELSLAVGDIIEFLAEVEDGWWRGRLGDKIGVFPSNFVEPLLNNEVSPILSSKKRNSIGSKKEINRSSLHSSKEDLLGTSPNNFLDNNKDSSSGSVPAPLLPPKPVREYCRVLYPYEPQNEDELQLRTDEIITILSKELPDKGWWKGELKGRIGVFPDNFVKILPSEVSPSKDSSHPDRPPTAANNSTSSSKIYVKKSGSGSSSQGSTNSSVTNRKDSFGSRDSLNDILSETGIVSGNVAAQRRSLENKNIDLSGGTQSIGGVPATSAVRRSLEANSKTSEIRKSLENMDEKKTPPPVLTKKPMVPTKKTTTVTSVAGNILSGFKQKVKSVESKLTSHENVDGIICSRMANSQLPDSSNEKNAGITIERITRKDESEFDNVERGSMLADMRAGRAKAPKRRPPSGVLNLHIDNNNSLQYLNGTSGGHNNIERELPSIETRRSTESLEGEELAKPKPREWEKKKAPWMEELKASQAKKTSPNVEARATSTAASSTTAITERSKSTDHEVSSTVSINKNINEVNRSIASVTSSLTSSNSITSNSTTTSHRRPVETVNSTSTSLGATSGSNAYEISSSTSKKEQMTMNNGSDMTKSLSALAAGNASQSVVTCSSINKVISASPDSSLLSTTDDVKIRPTSLLIRNRSVSPVGRNSLPPTKSLSMDHQQQQQHQQQSTHHHNVNQNHQHHNIHPVTGSTAISTTAPKLNSSALSSLGTSGPITQENVCSRVVELEQRIAKLEGVVQSQNKIIEELIRSLREETDRVKGLRNELDKYAQCVTQV